MDKRLDGRSGEAMDIQEDGDGREVRRRKEYSSPAVKQFGDLRALSKGTLAYSAEEGAYQEMNPPS